MNVSSMNEIRPYYIRHVDIVMWHASSRQRENIKIPIYWTNICDLFLFIIILTAFVCVFTSVSSSQITPSLTACKPFTKYIASKIYLRIKAASVLNLLISSILL